MKKYLGVAASLMVIITMFSGCLGKPKEYISVDENTYISDYTETVTTTYKETDTEGQKLYEELFDINNKVSVSVHLTREEIGKLQSDFQNYTETDPNKKSEIFRKADVTFTINSDSYTVEEVGIRLKGNQTIRPFYDYDGTPNLFSFKLRFDETFDDKEEYGDQAKEWASIAEKEAREKRTFAALKSLDVKWNINYDDTNIREIYATKLFESSDQLVQKIGLSQLKINDNNYGLVKIYEPVDKKFINKRLPKAAQGGDLYKCIWSECDNSGNMTGRWRGATYELSNSYGLQKNSEAKKFNYNLKTNKKTSNHEQLINLLEAVNKPDITEEELAGVIDIDSYANFMAAEYFSGDPDDIRNNFNNHYIYFRKDNGKAVFIVYDNDRTMGITCGMNVNCTKIDPYSNKPATMPEQLNPLIKNTITTDSLPALSSVKDKYTAALKKLSESEMLKSDEDFNKMYNIAKENYEDIVQPYMTFANQHKDFQFSLDGDENGGNTTNMSFEQFRSQIMNTYQNSNP